MKKFFGLLGMAVLGGAITLGGYKAFFNHEVIIERTTSHPVKTVTANYNPTLNKISSLSTTVDLTAAAENTVHAVVHVKNTSVRTQVNPVDVFFGNGGGTKKFEQVGTGSGVIISQDGYIVTNNHVIDEASDIEITLNNKKKYKAKLIGTDKENDIALLKIDTGEDLAYIPFANSDTIKIGEWVLAVGNPYNLTSTVTAGIVSAKGRDLEGNGNKVESYIQTDAAVNPGNSGGALVNSRGELVGINTAITSKTGSFIGYSFAVPSNIARKIIDDLLEFGSVQEAILGINIDRGDNSVEGVKIASVIDDGEAEKSGLQAGDIIKKVNSVKISKFSELRGQLTAKRPGDLVDITIDRDGEDIIKSVKLSKKDSYVSNNLKVVLKDLTEKELKEFNISGGAKIIGMANKNLKYYGIKEGYVILKINKKQVLDASEAAKSIDAYYGNGNPILIEVLNLDGQRERYAFR